MHQKTFVYPFSRSINPIKIIFITKNSILNPNKILISRHSKGIYENNSQDGQTNRHRNKIIDINHFNFFKQLKFFTITLYCNLQEKYFILHYKNTEDVMKHYSRNVLAETVKIAHC